VFRSNVQHSQCSLTDVPMAAPAAAAAPLANGGHWDKQVFKLREFSCSPACGCVKTVDFSQTMGMMKLRYRMKDQLASLEAKQLVVELSCWELKVRVAGGGEIAALSGDLNGDVRRDRSWWNLEQDEDTGDTVFVMVLAKKEQKAWSTLWKVGLNRQRKSHFGWMPGQKGGVKKAEEMLVALRPGRPAQGQADPFVINRELLCSGLEDGQDQDTAVIRIHLYQEALERVADVACIAELFGVDIMERYIRIFVRGDARSPIIMGTLGGSCIPELTRWEVVKARQLSGDSEDAKAAPRKVQYTTCLLVTIAKAKASKKPWARIVNETEAMLQRNAAPEKLEDVRGKAIRDASPDRTGWGAEDHAKEGKTKADTCFKRSEWRDASVFYTRAIRYTPADEKLYSNRSACYVKLKKYDKALVDAQKAIELKPAWPKGYYRQGLALRGLQRFDDAAVAFKDGRFRDPANADWEREIKKTESEQEQFEARDKEEKRIQREADMTTELNEATVQAERQAMVVYAEQALRAGKSRKEAGEIALKGAELAKQQVHDAAAKKKNAMVLEDDDADNIPAPYRIVHEDGTVHPKGFAHTEKGTYFMGMVVMNAERPPREQPWIEIRHPGRVRWSQGCSQVRMKVTLPDSIKSAADIDVKVTSTSIRIGTVGDSDPVVEGEFERKVDPEGENYAWYLIPDEKPPVLELNLDKDHAEVYQTFSYGLLVWPRLFSDDIMLGEGLFEADLTDLPPNLLDKWQREQKRADERSVDDRMRRKKMTEEEIMEETSRNWNDEFAAHGMTTRFDTNEDRMLDNARR